MAESRTTYRNSNGSLRWARAAFGGTVSRRLAKWSPVVPQVARLEDEMRQCGDDELRKRSLALRYEVKSGQSPTKILPQAYALVREAGRRTLEMRHFDVQILGGTALFHESFAEMQTGEGKTLVATLPLYLHALAGKGAHLATVNDYLAKRDAEWMQPIYEMLGLSVGIIQTEMSREDRRHAYACDITYGTAKEFGFDFLRDQLAIRSAGGDHSNNATSSLSEHCIVRPPHFALVDEADSILIDEARTPLIIGAFDERRKEQLSACYQWASASVSQFREGEEFRYDQEKKSVELTATGRQRLRMIPTPDIMNSVGLLELYEFMERGIKVARDFKLDREYVVKDDEIVIVDEFTGRLAEGRKWRDGIHQAIEAKEGVEVTVGTGQAARITVADLFLRYPHLGGMTGTGITSAREFRKVYRRHVIPIPTNRPPQRQRQPDRIFQTAEQKWQAVVEQVMEVHQQGRPVLIGTRSIDKSERISEMLAELGIDHFVLNARNVEAEAEIVAAAGEIGKVTVATNMAGRGTDIKLGDQVEELGGLHVICTELHDAQRIDRQLIGRCGRQGDPGTFCQYLALDDDILRSAYGKKKADRIASSAKSTQPGSQKYGGMFRRAQRKVEREHLRQRVMLNYHEKHRKKMFEQMGQNPYLDVPD